MNDTRPTCSACGDEFHTDDCPNRLTRCDDCGHVAPLSALVRPLPNVFERVAPGEIMPAGECRQCGAVAHLTPE